MKNRPFISIIIVCYNYAHLLPRALTAIASQTFRDFEIVFVDNGCTDNSLEVMHSFSEKQPTIPIVYVSVKQNIGLPYGDNKGVEAANGKYFMFHDADDWMDHNTLELLANAAKSNDADRVICAFRDVDESGKVTQIQRLGKQPEYWLYSLVQGNLFKGDLYKKLGIKTQTNSPDMEKTFWFSAFTKEAAYVFEPCYNMLVHMDSTSHRHDVYKKLLNDEKSSTAKLISLCLPWVPPKEDSKHILAVYALGRLYYGHIFRFLRYAPIKETIYIYDEIHSKMIQYLPDYLECVHEGLKYKNAIRPYGRRVTFLLYWLEKLHLMHLGLFVYHCISKLFYINE